MRLAPAGEAGVETALVGALAAVAVPAVGVAAEAVPVPRAERVRAGTEAVTGAEARAEAVTGAEAAANRAEAVTAGAARHPLVGVPAEFARDGLEARERGREVFVGDGGRDAGAHPVDRGVESRRDGAPLVGQRPGAVGLGDPAALYEAAEIDGAGKIKQILHVTLPGILPMVFVMTVLSLGNVLNAGFDQVFNLYSPQVYQSGDILDTFIYRLGIDNAQYSISTAVGLMKSVISLVLIALGYKLAEKYGDYRVF